MDVTDVNDNEESIANATNNNTLYVITVAMILLPSLVLSLLTAGNIRRFQEMLIKRNIFLIHLLICYFSLTLLDLIEVIRLHTDLLDRRRLTYWFYYPVMVSFCFGKYLILLCFFLDHIYENVKEKGLKITLTVVWSLVLAYLIILVSVTIFYFDKLGIALVYGPTYFNLAILVLLMLAFFLWSIVIICKYRQGNELTEDQKVRFVISLMAILCSLMHTIIDLTVPLLWPHIFLYIVDTLEVLLIISFLILYDVNFKYAFLKTFYKNRDYKINYVGVEQFDVRV